MFRGKPKRKKNPRKEVGYSRRRRECGIRSGLGSHPVPNLAPPPLRSGLAAAASGTVGSPRAGESGRSPRRQSPRRRRHRTPRAAGLLRVVPPCGSDAAPSDLSRSMLPRVRIARQRQMDYCSLPGRPPPPALQPPGDRREAGAGDRCSNCHLPSGPAPTQPILHKETHKGPFYPRFPCLNRAKQPVWDLEGQPLTLAPTQGSSVPASRACLGGLQQQEQQD
ncbi:uncharacterized protein AAES06_012983 [Glossophaga mutica]